MYEVIVPIVSISLQKRPITYNLVLVVLEAEKVIGSQSTTIPGPMYNVLKLQITVTQISSITWNPRESGGTKE